jgi:hypothetical protein
MIIIVKRGKINVNLNSSEGLPPVNESHPALSDLLENDVQAGDGIRSSVIVTGALIPLKNRVG